MYRTRHFRWKLMHLCGILTHLGLVVAVAVSYICDLSRTTQSGLWGQVTVVEMNSCRFTQMAGLGNGFTFDVATHTLLKACLAVGSLGFTINIALLALLLAVEPNRISLTEGEQHWRKQIVTFFGCLLNLLLAGAGVFLALTLGTKAADSKPLIAPLIWTYIQWPLAFSMAVCDAVKNHREGKDLLD
ncbi:hypothetical protein C8A01DRAFT_44288 [Parachaetomium inaequale]|uniref:Uncharacterized protein n=1 Tax=Parachaetomium inaequale TaxID=2588326 RepID=A0AAN6PMK8_9PEZI|nr:hypothetical protein C8A01DRAFT_44288 [Parachaetomium inaequale]